MAAPCREAACRPAAGIVGADTERRGSPSGPPPRAQDLARLREASGHPCCRSFAPAATAGLAPAQIEPRHRRFQPADGRWTWIQIRPVGLVGLLLHSVRLLPETNVGTNNWYSHLNRSQCSFGHTMKKRTQQANHKQAERLDAGAAAKGTDTRPAAGVRGRALGLQ